MLEILKVDEIDSKDQLIWSLEMVAELLNEVKDISIEHNDSNFRSPGELQVKLNTGEDLQKLEFYFKDTLIYTLKFYARQRENSEDLVTDLKVDTEEGLIYIHNWGRSDELTFIHFNTK